MFRKSLLPWLIFAALIISNTASYAQQPPAKVSYKLYWYNKNGTWKYDETVSFTYDSKGRPTTREAVKESSGKKEPLSSITYSYWNDEYGNEYERKYTVSYDKGVKKVFLDTTGRTPEGDFILHSTWQQEQGKWKGEYTLYTQIYKDAEGRAIAHYRYTKPVATTKLQLTDIDSFIYYQGRLMGIKHFKKDGQTTWHYELGEEFVYDQGGNVTSITEYKFFLGKPSGTYAKDSIVWHNFEKRQMKGCRNWMAKDGKWECLSRTTFTYSAEGHEKMEEKYDAKANAWIKDRKDVFLEGDWRHPYLTRNMYKWENGKWAIKFSIDEHKYTNNASGRPKELIRSKVYENGTVQPSVKLVYEY